MRNGDPFPETSTLADRPVMTVRELLEDDTLVERLAAQLEERLGSNSRGSEGSKVQGTSEKTQKTSETGSGAGVEGLRALIESILGGGDSDISPRLRREREQTEIQAERLRRKRMMTTARDEARRSALMARLDRMGVPYAPDATVATLERMVADANRSRKGSTKTATGGGGSGRGIDRTAVDEVEARSRRMEQEQAAERGRDAFETGLKGRG